MIEHEFQILISTGAMEYAVNVFDRALEIIEEHGWHQRDWHGPDGERCLVQAWGEANEELHPAPRQRWWRKDPPWPAVAAYRAAAETQARVLRAAIEQFMGEKLWGCEAQWNDERASEEDVRLALKIAARNLEERQHVDGRS